MSVVRCVKYVRKQLFSDPYSPVYGENILSLLYSSLFHAVTNKSIWLVSFVLFIQRRDKSVILYSYLTQIYINLIQQPSNIFVYLERTLGRYCRYTLHDTIYFISLLNKFTDSNFWKFL